MFIESTKDIFWLVLAFVILWLALFMSWMMYYAIKMMRDMSQMTDKVSETVSMIHGIVKSFKNKSENVAGYIAALMKSSDQLKRLFNKDGSDEAGRSKRRRK